MVAMSVIVVLLIAPLTAITLAVRAYNGRGTRPLYIVTMLGAQRFHSARCFGRSKALLGL